MINKKIYSLAAVALLSLGCQPKAEAPAEEHVNTQHPFWNSELSIDERVDDLVSRMTLEEKVAQMFDKSPAIPRLNVPEYNWWNEALHGVARAGTATVFPQAIGLASTFDEELLLKIGTAISDEGRAKHHRFLEENNRSMYTGLTYWSPNINIFRDPRWGRGQETYGEDPYLSTRMAINFVNGVQGNDDVYLKAVATLKHYAVHSGPEITRHTDDYRPTPKDLVETYLPAFRDTIAETELASVMCAYNAVDGEPACGNSNLIQNYLRDQFGFTGYIVSDCGAIADFYDPKSHFYVDTPEKAAAHGVKTGTDLNCGDYHGNTYSYLTNAVAQGLITEEEIDVSLKRLMKARFKLGMFDSEDKVSYSKIPYSVVGSAEHLALTREAAEKSLVLLKNDGILPLEADVKVAVIGPNADNLDILLGNYNGKPVNPLTPLEGIKQYLGDGNVQYAPGSALAEGVYSHYQPLPANVLWHKNAYGKLVPGLIAEYYPDPHFFDQPVIVRVDSTIDFAWEKAPINGLSEDEFGIRWQGFIKPVRTSTYQFSIANNMEVKINGELVTGPVTLEEGKLYSLAVESLIVSTWWAASIEPEVELGWLDLEKDMAAEAMGAVDKSDVIIFVGGISARLEGEERDLELDGFSHGDRTHINLPKPQEDLLKALHKTGKPIVYVNLSGSAIALNWQEENASAVIQGFYPGEATGAALARLLWGQYSPSGRLPVTFYKSVDDLPAFTDYTMNNRTYKYYEGDVLYPFGYGLSYGDFSYNDISVDSSKASSGSYEVTVTVSNSGLMDSDEVVQLYLSMPDTNIKTPIQQLTKFQRIEVAKNTSAKVTFSLGEKDLVFVDNDGQLQPYLGELLISVNGGLSPRNGGIAGVSTTVIIR